MCDVCEVACRAFVVGGLCVTALVEHVAIEASQPLHTPAAAVIRDTAARNRPPRCIVQKQRQGRYHGGEFAFCLVVVWSVARSVVVQSAGSTESVSVPVHTVNNIHTTDNTHQTQTEKTTDIASEQTVGGCASNDRSCTL